MDLTQAEADRLIAMPKEALDPNVIPFPPAGERIVIPLISTDKTEDFLLDIMRSRVDLGKVTFQHRGHAVEVLLRLDLAGAPHRNPDGAQVPCPHLHVYKEGFGDKWAYPLPSGRFTKPDNLAQTLSEFMDHCHVVTPSPLQLELF